jgi:hypothetical protein
MMTAVYQYRSTLNHKPVIQEVPVFLRLTELKQSWIKKFHDGTQALDLAQYAYLIINLSQGFEIQELKIGKSLSASKDIN